MSTTTSPERPEDILDGSYTGPVAVRGRLLRPLVWTAPTDAAMIFTGGAVPGILLAVKVEHLDPASKIANLAVGDVWLFASAVVLCVLGALAVLPIRSVR
ncbi:hypothetical protein [Paramicrobacterium chengjingii]|uniref:hypothetical protein n=1 Tax=Paramicrobacterium chengjingii TaxID=2769067 RepID=UPI00141D85AC|nr:hypothetical protein [Microbacterium chengjingii]